MARTIRNAGQDITTELPMRIYKTGGYVRLSVLDGNKGDSDSIENQESMLRRFIDSDPSLSLHAVYSDNGQSGVNFARDDFERLLDDIKDGKIDCVVVKDLSRFGRNYLEAGEYLEKIFPFMGVRFIAINDGYDSLDLATSDSLSMHLKNLVNDIYARDISAKISPVLRGKQERGEFIGAWATYGYLKSEEDKHRLVLDDEVAHIVRYVFQWRLMGMSYQNIARKLTQLGIPSPSQHRYAKGLVKDARFACVHWKISTIKAMLDSEVYLGHMVQGKKRESLFQGQKQTMLPKDEWIIVRNTHEAIIDQSTFDAVQYLNEKANREYTDKLERFSEIVNTENILKGLVYCGECSTKLIRYKNVRENKSKRPKFHVWYSYICPKHTANLSDCTFQRIGEIELYEVVFQVIQSHFTIALDIEKLIKSARKKKAVLSKKQQIYSRIQKAKDDLVRVYRLRESLCDDHMEHLMSERDYIFALNRYKEQEETLNVLIVELEAQEREIIETKTEENPWLQALLSFKDESALTRKMAEELIDHVVIHSKTAVTVYLRFQDEYERLQKGLSLPSGGCRCE